MSSPRRRPRDRSYGRRTKAETASEAETNDQGEEEKKSERRASLSPRRLRRASKKPGRSQGENFPFLEADCYADLIISVDDQKIYTSKAILAYNSEPLYQLLQESTNTKQVGKSKERGSSGKNGGDLDWSGKDFRSVEAFCACIDPRCQYYELDDDRATLALPLAQEFKVKHLIDKCEKAITSSYKQQHERRRMGTMATDLNIHYLGIADQNDFVDLKNLCEHEFMCSGDPDRTSLLCDSRRISEPTKRRLLQRLCEDATRKLANERRVRSSVEMQLDSKRRWQKA